MRTQHLQQMVVLLTLCLSLLPRHAASFRATVPTSGPPLVVQRHRPTCSVPSVPRLLLGPNGSPGQVHQHRPLHTRASERAAPSTSAPPSPRRHHPTMTSLGMAQSDQDKEYSTEVRLRVEAESPFRNVRTLVYSALLAGATISLLLSLTRIVAALNGINADLMGESLTNAGVDALGIAVLGWLLYNDFKVQRTRLKMASRGAELAGLNVRVGVGEGSVSADGDGASGSAATTTTAVLPLSSLRRGRGLEKRVVIAVGGADCIGRTLAEVGRLSESLVAADLLVVPVVVPQCAAPIGVDVGLLERGSVGLPVGGGSGGGSSSSWKDVIEDEANDATEQGVKVKEEGMCIILKKNGRVGQRTSGINLGRMVGEVEGRREAGMDVSNI